LDADLFYARAAVHLARTGDPRLTMLYLPGPDVLRRLIDRGGPDPALRRARWTESLDAYWSALGPVLERVLESPDPGTPAVLVLLTTPGRPFGSGPVETGYLGVTGPGAAAGALGSPVALRDITPTLLWLLGLPYSEEMEGRPVTGILDATARAALGEPRAIETYGRQVVAEDVAATGDLDEPMLELLRSLGYIDR
jgi:hypothetical protein